MEEEIHNHNNSVVDQIQPINNSVGELGNNNKRKGRPPRAAAPMKPKPAPKAAAVKEDDEDVCFICFDGGSLVLCDHRYIFIFICVD